MINCVDMDMDVVSVVCLFLFLLSQLAERVHKNLSVPLDLDTLN